MEILNSSTATVVSTGYTGGGLSYPYGIAVDGAGNVWVTNYYGIIAEGTEAPSTISELQGANGAKPGQPISPSTGYGSDAGLLEPHGIAIDASGNVWVSNADDGANSITQFLGVATPVKTPLAGPPQLP